MLDKQKFVLTFSENSYSAETDYFRSRYSAIGFENLENSHTSLTHAQKG